MKPSRTTLVFVAGLLALGAAVAGLYWFATFRNAPGKPLIVYAAPAVRVPLERIAAEYEAAHGRRVELRFGASEDVLTKAGMVDPSAPADILFPADASYLDLARDRGLIGERFPVASMRAVVLAAPGNPKGIAAWPDLLRDGVTVAVPNPAAAAGKISRDHLAATGKWNALKPRTVDVGTVTEAANAAKVGSADAAIVWDAVAFNYPGQAVLPLPELAGATARVEVATLAQSADPAEAARFARYVVNEGLIHFRNSGFQVLEAKTPPPGPLPEAERGR